MKDAFAVLRQTVEKHYQKGFRESSWQCPFRTEQQCKAYKNCKDCLYDKMLDVVAEAEAEVNRLPEEDWMT